MSLDEMQADVARLEAELKEAKRRLYEARCDAAGVHVGDVVLAQRWLGKPWEEVWVERIEPSSSPGKTWGIYARPKRKNGEWFLNAQWFASWKPLET